MSRKSVWVGGAGLLVIALVLASGPAGPAGNPVVGAPLGAAALVGAAGTLDTTFGPGGIAYLTVPMEVYGLAVQADGKLVAVGRTAGVGWGITRLNTNGTVDESFGLSGQVVLFGDSISDRAVDVAIDDDTGKIYVTGQRTPTRKPARFTLVRLLSSGSLDTSFSGDGIAEIQIGSGSFSNSLAIQDDGKILVGGSAVLRRSTGFAVARFLSSGALDTEGFGPRVKPSKPLPTTGYITHEINTSWNESPADGVIALDPDGNILLGGDRGFLQDSWIIARYLGTDGSLDTSFASQGVRIQTFGGFDVIQLRGIAVNDGKLYASGRGRPPVPGTYHTLLASYTLDGNLDPGFGAAGLVSSGYLLEDNGAALAIQTDGKIVVAAQADTGTVIGGIPVFDVIAFRFETDGDSDTTFDGDGMSVFAGIAIGSGARTVALDDSGSIFVAGSAASGQGVVVKYNP